MRTSYPLRAVVISNGAPFMPILSQLHMSNDPFYGLTEDGDFAILGINAHDDSDENNSRSTRTGQSVGDLSSLLSGVMFSGLNDPSTQFSRRTTATSMTVSSAPVNNAIFGRLDSTSFSGSDAKGDILIGEIGERSDNSQPQLVQSRRSSSVDEATISEIKEWLLSIIPALNDHDVEYYSTGLNKIGFSPNCVTMCELQFSDLDFMKLLHRRYLFNEVTGNEHPWEV